jgi:hypothetical protein
MSKPNIKKWLALRISSFERLSAARKLVTVLLTIVTAVAIGFTVWWMMVIGAWMLSDLPGPFASQDDTQPKYDYINKEFRSLALPADWKLVSSSASNDITNIGWSYDYSLPSSDTTENKRIMKGILLDHSGSYQFSNNKADGSLIATDKTTNIKIVAYFESDSAYFKVQELKS